MAEKRAFEKTSYEVRQKWDKENLKRYVVALRYDTDAELIEYIEQHKADAGTTQLFREALKEAIKRER